ncbi:MAG: hypothetical protein RAO94_13450 [Candidatus Stygibacter australis]|nr:hypothetical protein [Candidatus Stygibacter australis]MDP8323346.1 hypothetical protein [Candidatus Stygibacter australis]
MNGNPGWTSGRLDKREINVISGWEYRSGVLRNQSFQLWIGFECNPDQDGRVRRK